METDDSDSELPNGYNGQSIRWPPPKGLEKNVESGKQLEFLRKEGKNGLIIFDKHVSSLMQIHEKHVSKHEAFFFPKSSTGIKYTSRAIINELIQQDRVSPDTLDKERQLSSPGLLRESVLDYKWGEQKLELSQLPDYYKRLSKIRLTGNYASICIISRDLLKLYLVILLTNMFSVQKDRRWLNIF